MRAKHELGIHQFLAIYRFFSFGWAVLQVQVIPLSTPRSPPLEIYITLSLLGIYSVLKVFSPLRWRQQSSLNLVMLGGDAAVCVFLVLFTRGLDSGYLLYSLNPLLAAALLLRERIAMTVAALTAAAPLAAHVGLSWLSKDYAWVLEGNYLALLIIYMIFSSLIAIVPFRTNLNMRRRIEREAVLEERGRIRRELHDGVAQALNYLNLKTKAVTNWVSRQQVDEALAGLTDIRQTVQSTYEDVREAIDQLSLEAGARPLLPTLQRYLREFSQQHGVEVNFQGPKALHNLSPVVEVQLLRIAQEAMSNVRKHASATQVRVTLEDTRKGLSLMVKDNGRGFRLGDQAEYAKLRGLAIMRERVEELGGTLEITSVPGQGTEVQVHLPEDKVRF